LADVLRELKKASSIWVHDEIGAPAFAWQEGYAAFIVGPTSRVPVRRYIEHQEEHHRRESFREELVEFLEKAAVSFDMQYLD